MPSDSDFLPAERLEPGQVLAQAGEIARSPALVAMLDTVPALVALLNPERQIVFCNEACARAGGLAHKEDAVGMRPGELLHCVHSALKPGGCGTSATCRHCTLVQSLMGGQVGIASSGECLLQCEETAQGGSAEYHVQVTPLPQLGAGWQCFSLQDISDQKRREALERTFFHDILNRAGAVQAISKVLAEPDLVSTERDEFLGMLTVSAGALVDEVHSQRTLLAAERGALEVDNSECDSLVLVEAAVAACRSFGVGNGTSVTIEAGAERVVFQSDPSLLGRILINLLKNALEADEKQRSVEVNCTTPAAGRVRFSVHNDAVLPESVRTHIYHRSFSTKGPGRGLGTYSIKLLTESYLGGLAWFVSSPEEGTTFHVEFDA